jgi:NAD-dependent dihydropyrimidine dehydrogenase PreA subunit
MPIRNFDREKCTGCGICVACCPMDVLRLDKKTKKAVIQYPKDCVACWGCESFCPRGCFDVSPERGRGELVSPY